MGRYCRGCGKELQNPNAVVCPNCGGDPKSPGKYCPECGKELQNPNAVVCPSCGEALGKAAVSQSGGAGPKQKEEFLAVALSFFVPGLGQLYNGQVGKGVAYFIIAIVFLCMTLIVIGALLYLIWWLVSMVDAYTTAGKINRGEPADDFINFG